MGPTDCRLLFPPHDDLRRRYRRGRGYRCDAGAAHKAKITQFTSRAATKTDGPCGPCPPLGAAPYYTLPPCFLPSFLPPPRPRAEVCRNLFKPRGLLHEHDTGQHTTDATSSLLKDTWEPNSRQSGGAVSISDQAAKKKSPPWRRRPRPCLHSAK